MHNTWKDNYGEIWGLFFCEGFEEHWHRYVIEKSMEYAIKAYEKEMERPCKKIEFICVLGDILDPNKTFNKLITESIENW